MRHPAPAANSSGEKGVHDLPGKSVGFRPVSDRRARRIEPRLHFIRGQHAVHIYNLAEFNQNLIYMDKFHTIGARFKAERKRLGLSQEELADLTQLSRGTIVACENDRAFATHVAAFERARLAGMDTWWVQTGTRAEAIGDEQWKTLHAIAKGVEEFIKENALPRSTAMELKLIELVYRGLPVEDFLGSGEVQSHVSRARAA